MAQQVAEQDQGAAMQQAEQMQQEQRTQGQQRIAQLRMMKYGKKIRELKNKIDFHRNRAAEHDDGYFAFLAGLAVIIDGADLFDGVGGFIIMIFTFWVPLVYKALFYWGPRHYVWTGPNYMLISIATIAVKWTPWLRALPLNTTNVTVNWIASIEHKELDLVKASMYEVKLKMMLRLLKRAKL